MKKPQMAHFLTRPPAAFDLKTAAAVLGLTEKALRRHVDRRRIPFRRLGRKIIFLTTELQSWLASLPGMSIEEIKSIHELDRNGHTR